MIDEGYIKFESDWRRTEPLGEALVADLVRWRRPLYEAGLIGQYEDLGIGFGNLSRRCRAPGLFVISGTQTGHLAELGPEHFSLVTGVDVERNRVTSQGAAEASSESMTHALLYDVDAGIHAVVHVHSAALWKALLGRIPTSDPDVPYGTPEMAAEIGRLYRDTDFSQSGVAVMGGHEEGLISVGATLEEACLRMLALAG